jgi:hypothetical protein
MDTRPTPRVVSVERLQSGVIIDFEDGKSAVYSASLLYSVLSRAERLPDKSSRNDFS